MVCSNCKSETNGLKLNNRLYCTECGFLLSTPEPEPVIEKAVHVNSTRPKPKPIEKKTESVPKYIPIVADDKDEEFALGPLEAEEEVLDLAINKAKELEKEEGTNNSVVITTKAKLPHTRNTIKKHHRHRTDLKMEGDFVLIPGEPDPIAEPEIEAASGPDKEDEHLEIITMDSTSETEKQAKHHIQEGVEEVEIPITTAESSTDTKEELKAEPEEELPETKKDEDVIDTEKEEDEAPVAKGHNNDLLLNYFKQQVGQNSSKPQKTEIKKKSRKPKGGYRWGLFLSIAIPAVIIVSLISLVLYVNLYATRPDVAVSRATQEVTFPHLKATYIPYGYSVSYRTTATPTSISYVYDYLPDKSRFFTIKAEKTLLNPDDIRPKVLNLVKKPFTNVTEGDRSLWLVGDDSLYFIESGVLYTITSNSELSSAELTKIAVGLK